MRISKAGSFAAPVGLNDPHEVCTYPDNGKVLIRSLKTVGRLAEAPYMDGEPSRPKVLGLAQELVFAGKNTGGG